MWFMHGPRRWPPGRTALLGVGRRYPPVVVSSGTLQIRRPCRASTRWASRQDTTVYSTQTAKQAGIAGDVSPHGCGTPVHLVQATLGHAALTDDQHVNPRRGERQLSALPRHLKVATAVRRRRGRG